MNIKNKIQLARTMFLTKYGSLSIYEIESERRFIIDHEQLKFDNKSGCKLIGNLEEPGGYWLDHDCFLIHDDLFDIIQSTHHDKISCGCLYQMNQMKTNLSVKQQRYVTTRSKIRRGLLPNNSPSIIFRERGIKFQLTVGKNHLMN